MRARRLISIGLIAGVTSLVVAPSAQADPPSNDDRADATVVTALPHEEDVVLSEATVEPDEPDCYSYVYIGEPPSGSTSVVSEAGRLDPRSFGLKASHEEPQSVTTNTVWYSLTTSSTERVSIDTFDSGDDQDTILAVYTVDEAGALQLVTCNDDARYLNSRVLFEAEAGREYLVQLGAWYGNATSASLRMRVAPPPGQVSGQVVDDATGAPIEGVCVDAYAADWWSWGYAGATTAADGTYVVEVEEGSHVVRFSDCDIDPADEWYHQEEFYDDAVYWEDATPVQVAAGAEVLGIDAGLTLVEGNPWARSDVAVTSLEVERVIPQVDGASLVGPGIHRIVHVELSNLGRGNGHGVLDVEICPTTAALRCTYLEPQDYELIRDETIRFSLPWNGTGTVGDVEVRAIAESCSPESDWDNNTRATSSYVTIGGTGVGAGVGRGSRSFSCWW